METRRRTLPLALVVAPLLLAGSVRATTWTVSPSGGGGQFTDIQSAVDAASSGDTILVLAGSYPPFVLNKALRVLGVGPSLVTVSMAAAPSPPPAPAVVQVTGIPAGQFAIVAGMRVQIVSVYPLFPGPLSFCYSFPDTAAISVTNCSGPVALSNLQVDPGHYFHGLKASQSSLVLEDHVVVLPQPLAGCGAPFSSCIYSPACVRKGIWAIATNLSANDSPVSGNAGSTALRVEGASQSLLARSALTGSNGVSVICSAMPFGPPQLGLDGGNGLDAAGGASVRVAGGGMASIQGGSGAPGSGLYSGGCCVGGDGGHAIVSSGASVLRAPDVALAPGAGGYALPCSGAPGLAVNGTGVTAASAPLPSLGVNPVLASPGGSVSFEVRGSAGALYLLGLSLAPAFLPIPGIGGPLLLDPASLMVFASGTLDPSGAASLMASVPAGPGVSGTVLFFQPAAVAGGSVNLGPGVAFAVL